MLWNFHRFIFMLISMVHLILNAKWLEELASWLCLSVLFRFVAFDTILIRSIPFHFVSFRFVLFWIWLVVCAFMSQIERRRHNLYIHHSTSYVAVLSFHGGDWEARGLLIDGALIAWSPNTFHIYNIILYDIKSLLLPPIFKTLISYWAFVNRSYKSFIHFSVSLFYIRSHQSISYMQSIGFFVVDDTNCSNHIYSHIPTSLSVFNSF